MLKLRGGADAVSEDAFMPRFLTTLTGRISEDPVRLGYVLVVLGLVVAISAVWFSSHLWPLVLAPAGIFVVTAALHRLTVADRRRLHDR